MRISVLIPAYNAGDFIEATLKSVTSFLSTEDEVIVVDDHSQDRTAQLAQTVLSHASCQSKVVLNEGKGACRARNYAFTLSTGNWIQWLDADDLIPQNKWECVLPLAEGGTLVGCTWRPFQNNVPDGVINDGRDWSLHLEHDAAEWLAEDRMMIPASWFGERHLFQSTAGWDETLSVNQDGEYFTRVIRHASMIRFTSATEVFYRRGLPHSTSSFTPEKADSLFRSTASMVDTALSLEDSLRMQQMASNRWQQFIFTAYPHRSDLIKEAEQRLRALPPPNLNNPLAVSKTSRLFVSLFGWKALTQTRMWRQRFAI